VLNVYNGCISDLNGSYILQLGGVTAVESGWRCSSGTTEALRSQGHPSESMWRVSDGTNPHRAEQGISSTRVGGSIPN